MKNIKKKLIKQQLSWQVNRKIKENVRQNLGVYPLTSLFFFSKYNDSFHRFENDCFISFVTAWGKRVGNIKERLPLLWHHKADKYMGNSKILLSKLHTEEI